jgi:hypothetical protein
MTLNEVSQLRVGSTMRTKDGKQCHLVLPTDYPHSIRETPNGTKYVPLTTTLGSMYPSTQLTKV